MSYNNTIVFLSKLFITIHSCFQGIHRCFLRFCRVSFAGKPEDEGEANELIVELEGKDEKRERETNMWFSKV